MSVLRQDIIGVLFQISVSPAAAVAVLVKKEKGVKKEKVRLVQPVGTLLVAEALLALVQRALMPI